MVSRLILRMRATRWLKPINKINWIHLQEAWWWTRYKRNKSSFLKYQCSWLNEKETILINSCKQVSERAQRGRPKLDFAESSARTKRRRMAQLNEIDVSALRNENQMQNLLPADSIEVISLIMETCMTKSQ